MASSQPGSVPDKTLSFVKHLSGAGFSEKQTSFEAYLDRHPELTTEGAPVSPRVFRVLFDEFYEPTLQACMFIEQQLSDTWNEYATLGSSEQEQERKKLLQVFSDMGAVAKPKFHNLLKKTAKVIEDSSRHVNWQKHFKNNFQEKTRDWLDQKHQRLNGSLSDDSTVHIRLDVTAVRDCLALAIESFASPITDSPNERGVKASPYSTTGRSPSTRNVAKRSLDDQTARSPPKRRRREVAAGTWWGPNNSKLTSSKLFNSLVEDYKGYLVAPKYPPGTQKHMECMVQYLQVGLEFLNMHSWLDALLLKPEWDFFDGTSTARPPSFIDPAIGESIWRNGTAGNRGFNEIKTGLGGGLSPMETLVMDNPGSTANKHAMRAGSLLLRGGASGGEDGNAKKRKLARINTQLHFRDPADLWQQLLEDARYPPDEFYNRVKEERPPMMDPNRVGDSLPKFKKLMGKTLKPTEWDAIQAQTDPAKLQEMVNGYHHNVTANRQKGRDFLDLNPRINLQAPKLHEDGGQEKRNKRYNNLRDKDFVEPIGRVFEARMNQIFRLASYWKLYLSGKVDLRGLLNEEREHLAIWNIHEELYMEWENNRWFSLRDKLEREDCIKRYDARALLRYTWAREIQSIDKTIEILVQNPDRYNSSFGTALSANVLLMPPSNRLNPRQQDGRNSFSGSAVRTTISSSQSQNKASDERTDPTEGKPEISRVGQEDVQMAGSGNFGNNNHDNDSGDDNNGDNNDNAYDDDNDAGTVGKKFALEFLQKTRHVYEKKLNEELRKNGALDAEDPGNATTIHRNNIHIMSLQQTLWSFDTEIHNMQRSVDPLAAESYGRGAEHRWELPDDESYWRYTRKIPKKQPLPLGITSLNLGPLPGEHATPSYTRVLVGAGPNFGAAPLPGQEPALQTQAAEAGAKVPVLIDGIPRSWPQLLQLHAISWKHTEQSDMALLEWEEWTEAVYRALENDVRSYVDIFPDESPFKLLGESLRRHVNSIYGKQFQNSSFRHNIMPWRERETHRQDILRALSEEVNQVLRDNSSAAILPEPEPLGPAPALTAQAEQEAILERLGELVRKKNNADARIRLLNRRKQNGKSLTEREGKRLANVEMRKNAYMASYKTLRDGADPATRAQADLMYQQVTDEYEAAATIVEKGEDKAAEEEQAYYDEMLRHAQDTKDRISAAAVSRGTTTGTQKTVQALDLIDDMMREQARQQTQQQAQKPAPQQTQGKKAQDDSQYTAALQNWRKAKEVDRRKLQESVKRLEAEQQKIDVRITKLEEMAGSTTDQAEKAKALEDLDTAYIELQLNQEELEAQQAWDDPSWSASQLQEAFDELGQPIDVWRDSNAWPEGQDTVQNVYQQWSIGVINWWHQAMKAQRIFQDSPYFLQMYEYFWLQMPGDTLERKRKMFLHGIATRLHQDAAASNNSDASLIRVPPQPPTEWYEERQTQDKLLEQAQETLAPTMKSAEIKLSLDPKPLQNRRRARTEPTRVLCSGKTYPSPPLTPVLGISGSDAWPDLKDLLQATWSAIIAYHGLRQRPGDTKGRDGRPGWPMPLAVPHQSYVDL